MAACSIGLDYEMDPMPIAPRFEMACGAYGHLLVCVILPHMVPEVPYLAERLLACFITASHARETRTTRVALPLRTHNLGEIAHSPERTA